MKIIDTPHKRKHGHIIPAFYSKQERQTILQNINGGTVVGSTAFNRQMKYPIYKKRPIGDVDVQHKQPRRIALKVESALDENIGFNNYYVSELQHNGDITYRVHSRVRNTVVSDISKQKKQIPTISIDDTKYETLEHRKQAIQKMLDDPEAEYRREKDRIMMGYIKRAEKLEKMKRQMRW